VATVQLGLVVLPIVGGIGMDGLALSTTLFDSADVHPAALVTVKR
jgi:hypothetical protein